MDENFLWIVGFLIFLGFFYWSWWRRRGGRAGDST